ncbi:MAG: enoyl-CoA hydratase/isomerase family protein [Deltaproteobacteria bacterium]|nr:enoyl-CoA hydratase/isomerase family protein [Deltaproteobacteria bacterium]
MTTYTAIRAENRGPAAWLILDRPERRNPLGPAVTAELCHALEAAREDPAVRVVVLAGEGKVFSAGGDLGGMGSLPEGVPARDFVELLLAMTRLGKPTIARVHGAAMGGGLGLAVACDVTLVAEDCRLGTPEIDVGLFPMMIMAVLLRAAPRKPILEMMLTGARIDAREAARLGLVTRAVPPGELDAEVDRLVAALAAKSPSSLRLGLEAYHGQLDLHYAEALPYLRDMLGRIVGTDDAREGIQAFLEKRPPRWSGR